MLSVSYGDDSKEQTLIMTVTDSSRCLYLETFDHTLS